MARPQAEITTEEEAAEELVYSIAGNSKFTNVISYGGQLELYAENGSIFDVEIFKRA